MALYNADLKPLANGVSTHPYDHATRLFLADNFRLAPKQTFLYYVCINVDQSALQSLLGSLGSEAVSSQTLIEQYETGLMAKRVELPRFNVQTRALKAYNRKNIFQTGISYDPITISFHDDVADTVTKFWNDFYTYYYRDSDYDATLYQAGHKYQPRRREGWGFSPRNGNLKPFLRDIQIFSLHNKRFTEYRLINPIITQWRHGEHDSSASNGILEAQMTVDFETVKYFTGYVNPVDVNGFAVIHYDDTPSPISTSVTNIYSDAGLLGAIEGTAKDLARPDGTGSGSGILSSVLGAYQFYNQLKNTNFTQLGSLVLGQVGAQIINGAVNGAVNNVLFPTTGSTSQVYPQPASVSSASYPASSNAVTVGGVAAAIVTGAAVGVTNAVVNKFSQGVQTSSGPLPNPNYNRVYQYTAPNDYIAVNGRTGQPETKEQNSFVIDAKTGEITSTFTTIGSQNGGYTPGQVNTNLHNIIQSTDSNGNLVETYVYNNGDRVTFNELGDQLSIERGQFTDPGNTNTNPQTPQQIAAQGQTVNTNNIQYSVDPNTGLIYTVGGTASAAITNTLAGTGGLIAGGYVGGKLYSGLSGVLGNGVIGQTVNAAVSGVAGAVVGKAVNNFLQPVINNITGSVTQIFDSGTGSVRNVVGSWTGTGGFDAGNVNNNVVTSIYQPGTGGYINTYKDGSVVELDAYNEVISKTGPSSSGIFSDFGNWFKGSTGSNSDIAAALPGYGVGVVIDGAGNPIQTGSGFLFSGGSPDQIAFSDDFYQFDDFASGGVFGPTFDDTFTWNYDAAAYGDVDDYF